MLTCSRLGRLVAGLALTLALYQPAMAAPKEKPDPSAPSYVDLRKVMEAYQKTSGYTKLQQKAREKAKVFQEEMQALAQLRYCTPEERKEALELRVKPKPTAKEQARLTQLMGKAEAVDNEFSMLSQKSTPTAAETKRLQELTQLRNEATRTLGKEDADRREQMRKLDLDLATEMENELLELVAKVAKEEKLTFVYERRAVLFGGNDLTDIVLKKLPK